MAAELRARGLAGRADELAAGQAALSAALRGEGGLLLLTGEAGVGKTRMLAEVVGRARSAGAAVLPGRAVPGGGALRAVSDAVLSDWRGRPFPEVASLRPFRAALSRLVPGWADPGSAVPSPQGALVTAEALLELFATAYDRPVVLALEDLHWADAESLELLDRLAAGLARRPVLVAGTWRTGDPGTPAAAPRSWTVLHPVALGRLDDGAGRDLLRDCAGAAVPDDVADAVLSAAGGLPLLVEELLTGLVERGVLTLGRDGWQRAGELRLEVPAGLADLVGSRLDGLGDPARTVLQAAAVAGEDVDHVVLAAAVGTDEHTVLTALRGGVDANLLTGGGQRLGWRHALTRDAVLATLLAPERAATAARLAAALDKHPAAGPAGAERAARLWAAAGRPDRAVPALLGLSRTYADRGDLAAAEQLVREAGALGDADVVALDLVRVLTLRGASDEARRVGEAALLRAGGSNHTELGLALAAACVQSADWAGALAVLDRTAVAGDRRADAVRADALFGAGDVTAAAQLAEGVVAAADAGEDVDPVAVSTALEVAGRCARTHDHDAAAAWFDRAARYAAEHGMTPRRVRALQALGLLDFSRTEQHSTMQEARDLAEATGMPGVVAGIGVILSEVDLMVSGPATGVRRARETAALADRIGSTALRDTATLLSAWALAFDADQPAAAAALGEVGRAVGPDDREGLSLAAEAVAPLLAHDLAAASALLDAATTALGRNPAGAPVSVWGLWYLVRVVLDQDPDEAAARFAAAPGGHRAANVAAGQLAEAVRLGRAGRGDDAVAVQAEAERVLAAVPWWARVLRLLVHEAALADGWGDPLPTLRADLAAFEADDAKGLARTARELLRRGGVTVRRGRGDSVVPGWAAAYGVTSREYDVLEMVAGGSTNAEVAARLHLSARTVEHHVARVLAKAGRPDRRALARWYADGQAGRAPGGDQR